MQIWNKKSTDFFKEYSGFWQADVFFSLNTGVLVGKTPRFFGLSPQARHQELGSLVVSSGVIIKESGSTPLDLDSP